MAKRTLAGKRVIVSGASSGIGRELALALARRGAVLVVNARREEQLGQAVGEMKSSGAEVEAVVGDITRPETRRRLAERAMERFGGLDVLVNNAGIGAVGSFEHATEVTLRQVFEVNFFAPAELTREVLPLLKQGQQPMVVNIGSVLAHRAVGRMGEYCASKYALRGLSEALRVELAKAGVDVLHVSPSRTETEFFDRLLGHQGEALWPALPRVPAAAVAERTVRAIERGQAECFPSLSGRLLTWVNRVAPRIVEQYLMYYEK